MNLKERLSMLAALCLLPQAALCAAPAEKPMPPTLSWSEFEKLPLPPPGLKIAYGDALQQFGELRLPAGTGPFPVAVLIHGGCWLNAFHYTYITRLAAAMAGEGIAVWTLEYRRLGDEGGGWPHTLLDAARATDHLRVLARQHPLDLKRVVSIGHSAGGQLALWLAARHRLPADSALYVKDPLRLAGVIGLAAITDLHTYRIGPPDSCNASVDQLMGGSPEQHAPRYAQASPLALLPMGVPQWLIQGGQDRIVTTTSVSSYVNAATASGDLATLVALPEAGHFELVAPQPPAWAPLRQVLRQALMLQR